MHTKQKILQISKERLKLVGFAIFFNILLAGSVCGTFAWYTYATRTGFEKEYHGTTVGDLGSLQAGIVSNVQLEEFVDYELAEDSTTLEDEGKYIYWCRPIIKASTINYVASNNGYATTSIEPVTSANYDGTSQFHLYRNPTYRDPYEVNEHNYALKNKYVFIPFVFRYEDIDSPGHYTSNQEIFFSGCDFEAHVGGENISKGVRLCLDNHKETYIINPSAEEEGTNNVGGVLDLNGDGFFDFNEETNREIIYGQSVYSEYLDTPTENDGDIPFAEITAFHSNHKKDVYALNEETYVPETVSYMTLEKFVTNALAATVTDADYHNLGCLDFYIYLEGWDLNVINQNAGAGFNMDIAFGVIL